MKKTSSFLVALILASKLGYAIPSVEQRLGAMERKLNGLEREVETLRAQNQTFKNSAKPASAVKNDYPVSDQHDSLSVLFQDVQTEYQAHLIEQAARLRHWEQAQSLYSQGAMSLTEYEHLQLQLKLDPLNE